MKRYRLSFTAILAAAVMVVVTVMAGCSAGTANLNENGSSSSTAAYRSSAPQTLAYDEAAEMPMADEDAGLASNGVMIPAQQDRKVVRYGYLTLETLEFDTALDQIISAITEAGGYIENQSVNGQSLYYRGDYYEREAIVNARVPADSLAAVTEAVSGLCNVVSESNRMEDITDSYYDVEARLETLRVQEERLLEILKKAEKLEDVISLEQALSEVRYEIESKTSALQRMDSQVTYSYLNITLQEVAEYNIVKATPKTFPQKLADSFGRSVSNIGAALQGILFFVIEDGPVLLLYLALLLIVVLLALRIYRAVRGRLLHHQKPHPASTDEQPKQDQAPPSLQP